ncbi:MAG: hypothetical protein ACKO96_08915, partial [Flammeovirgaceae bacterium]
RFILRHHLSRQRPFGFVPTFNLQMVDSVLLFVMLTEMVYKTQMKPIYVTLRLIRHTPAIPTSKKSRVRIFFMQQIL